MPDSNTPSYNIIIPPSAIQPLLLPPDCVAWMALFEAQPFVSVASSSIALKTREDASSNFRVTSCRSIRRTLLGDGRYLVGPIAGYCISIGLERPSRITCSRDLRNLHNLRRSAIEMEISD